MSKVSENQDIASWPSTTTMEPLAMLQKPHQNGHWLIPVEVPFELLSLEEVVMLLTTWAWLFPLMAHCAGNMVHLPKKNKCSKNMPNSKFLFYLHQKRADALLMHWFSLGHWFFQHTHPQPGTWNLDAYLSGKRMSQFWGDPPSVTTKAS